MRQALLVVLVAAAGCAAQGLPVSEGAGGGTITIGAGLDMAKPLGGPGASCMTACDCVSGLACTTGSCMTLQLGAMCCCESGDSPSGNVCQSVMGNLDRCGSGAGGSGLDMAPLSVDAGSCSAVSCRSTGDCLAAGCSMCGRRGRCR